MVMKQDWFFVCCQTKLCLKVKRSMGGKHQKEIKIFLCSFMIEETEKPQIHNILRTLT
jgi:hypothetical protein